MWLNGFLKKSWASKSLQKLQSTSGKASCGGRGVLTWMAVVHLIFFTEVTERGMSVCCRWTGKWDLRKQDVLQKAESER